MSSRLRRRVACAGVAAALVSSAAIASNIPAAAAPSLSVVDPTAVTWVETSSGFLHVIGEVQNANPDPSAVVDPAQSVHVACTLYDMAGTALKAEGTATDANILLKNDRSPFDAVFLVHPSFHHAGCVVDGGAPTTHVADHNFTTTITGVSTDTKGVQHVAGTVVNNNAVTDYHVWTMVTFRDGAGKLVDADRVLINNGEALPPGSANTASFLIDRYPDQPAWDGMIAHASTLSEGTLGVVVDPGPLAFDPQIQGTTSAPLTALIGNNGTGDLHVSNAALGIGTNFAITSNGCAAVAVHVDTTCAVGVTFTPTSPQPKSDTLTFRDDVDLTLHSVALMGTGLSPAQVSASPTAIDFGSKPVGSTTKLSVTVTSGGPGPLYFDSASFGPPMTGDIKFDASTCLAASPLVALGSCSVSFTFHPTAVQPSAATLNIAARDAGHFVARNSGIAINVTGTGTQGQLQVGPTSLDFGDQNVQSASASKPVTLTNGGSAPITFSPFSFSGAASGDYGETDNCGSGLDAGKSCNINVSFTPSTAGTRIAQLVITTSANSASINLTGNGVIPLGGYWLVGSTGSIATFGNAADLGSINTRLNKPIVGMAVTPDHRGYWLAASDGGIFTFGDAPFKGSTGNLRLNKPIVGMASTPSGQGYWMVASDGGIFTFGDAPFKGSTGSMRLNKPVVGMAPTASGNGYWLVASDGGIFTFGDAPFKGSTGSLQLNQPVDGMAATPSGQGYWLVASDGGIFTFGDASFKGSSGGNASGIVGMAATASGQGYRMASSSGTVLAFGDAPDLGSLSGGDPRLPIVGMATD